MISKDSYTVQWVMPLNFSDLYKEVSDSLKMMNQRFDPGKRFTSLQLFQLFYGLKIVEDERL